MQAVSRRGLLKRGAGLAVAAGAGAVALNELAAAPAKAAVSQTTVASGAIAPAVVQLADGPTITVDASAGNDFRVTLGGSRTLGNPANASDGQQIIFQITQPTTGSATITWDTNYEFPTALPQPTLSTTGNLTDLLGFIYNAQKGRWLFAAFVNGFY